MNKIIKIVLILGIISRLLVFFRSPDISAILLYALSIVVIGFLLRLLGRELKKNDKNYILAGLALFCTTPFVAFGTSPTYALILMIILSILFMVYISKKSKYLKSTMVILMTISIIALPIIAIQNTQGVSVNNLTHLSEPGIIGDVNQLRGEDESALIGRLMHNKSIYIYKYLENISALFNPAYLSSNILLIGLVPLVVGAYLYFKIRKMHWKYFLIWVLTVIFSIGFVTIDYWIVYLTVLLPVMVIFMSNGLRFLNKRYWWLLLGINFLISFMLYLVI